MYKPVPSQTWISITDSVVVFVFWPIWETIVNTMNTSNQKMLFSNNHSLALFYLNCLIINIINLVSVAVQ